MNFEHYTPEEVERYLYAKGDTDGILYTAVLDAVEADEALDESFKTQDEHVERISELESELYDANRTIDELHSALDKLNAMVTEMLRLSTR